MVSDGHYAQVNLNMNRWKTMFPHFLFFSFYDALCLTIVQLTQCSHLRTWLLHLASAECLDIFGPSHSSVRERMGRSFVQGTVPKCTKGNSLVAK